jgi:hypothetical protein
MRESPNAKPLAANNTPAHQSKGKDAAHTHQAEGQTCRRFVGGVQRAVHDDGDRDLARTFGMLGQCILHALDRSNSTAQHSHFVRVKLVVTDTRYA